MSINNTLLNPPYFYNPIGNTPPVNLTQDLPPEQKDADILLLGCGDARNVLFTCFADQTRKMDITCCDIEPMIHARNVLLFTLLIDDKANHNLDRIWNIYYHWKIDGSTLELLESQTDKLLQASESIDKWYTSVYGSVIRFCDERTLSCVRHYWSGFTMQHLTPSQKEERLSSLQAAINRAKANRPTRNLEALDGTGYRAAFPTGNRDKAWADLCKISQEWWDFGMVPSSNSSATKPTHLNPVFLYAPDHPITVYFHTSPLGGIPLSTAYTTIKKKSVFCLKNEGASSTERLVDSAKSHFTEWVSSFRRSTVNGLVLRSFCGDALALCLTLRNCQLTQLTSMNLFCHSYTNSPLILHHSDYGHDNNAAPLSFDAVDTSNLIDFIGPLNLLAAGSSLLKRNLSSCLYTELLVILDKSPVDRLATLFGVDVHSMALLFGLVLPDLFTNATNRVEEHRMAGVIDPKATGTMSQARSRLRWKLSGGNNGSCISPLIQIEANQLAKFLIRVHDAMFKLEDPSISLLDLYKLNLRPYNRASFAFLLSVLKTNIISDWDECIKTICDKIFSDKSCGVLRIDSAQDLLYSFHVFGVDSSQFAKTPSIFNQIFLSKFLPDWKEVPDQLCVTIEVPKERLRRFSKPASSLFVVCCFEGTDPDGKTCFQSFSSVQIVFGKIREEATKKDSHLNIEEDYAQIAGDSNMFVSVMVPTSLLSSFILQSKDFTPMVKCCLKYSPLAIKSFSNDLGPDLCFSSSKLTSKKVFFTRFMPGMSGLPKFAVTSNHQDKASSAVTFAHISDNGLKINALSKRISVESEAAKAKLAVKSTDVNAEFESPLTAVVSIAGSEKFLLEFPVPVSVMNLKVKVARTSLYIEVESSFLDPLVEDIPAFLLPCFLMKVPSGLVPLPWTWPYIDLDTMPAISLNGTEGEFGEWVHNHGSFMYSVQEFHRITSDRVNSRIGLKQHLMDIFLSYAGSGGREISYYGLYTGNTITEVSYYGLYTGDTVACIHALIVPSCFRLDLSNGTMVLDCALIFVIDANQLLSKFFLEYDKDELSMINVNEHENRAWKAIMPALVERCRTWKHSSECDYVKTGEVPLSEGLREGGRKWPICSCGVGKFPKGYLKDQIRRTPALRDLLDKFATRIAISPICAIPYVEDCNSDILPDSCANCGVVERINRATGQQNLLMCSRCKKAKYCSTNCQKADWKAHKPICKPLKN